MATTPLHEVLAREARPYVAIAVAVIIVLHFVIGYWATPLWLVVAALLWLFRDPWRVIPSDPLGVVSPVDARVVDVGPSYDPYVEREAIRIQLEMSHTGVFSVRGMTEGKVMEHWMHLPKAGKPDHRQHIVWVRTDEEDDLVMVMQPGRWVGRMRCYIAAGERVGQGQRCGIIPFGAEVVMYVPTKSQILVKPGDRVLSGSDLVAQLVHD
jgi:phosphatidylserine decarboxylase